MSQLHGATFDQFAARELPALLAYATALTGSPDSAADAVQEAMIRAALRWRRIGALDHPVAYVRRMVTNAWLGERRRWFARTVRTTDDLASLAPPGPDFSARSDLRADLHERLLRLPHRQRAVLVLRHYLGLADREIAVELGCTEGTVRSLASRGGSALRASFAIEDRAVDDSAPDPPGSRKPKDDTVAPAHPHPIPATQETR